MYVRIDLPWSVIDTTLKVLRYSALLMEIDEVLNLARNKGSTTMCIKLIQKYLCICFLLKTAISGEINELWGLQEIDMH